MTTNTLTSPARADRRDYAIVGFAVFNPGPLRKLTPAARRGVYLHELGHVVGLADVNNPRDRMYYKAAKSGAITRGYAAGLRAIKRSATCAPN